MAKTKELAFYAGPTPSTYDRWYWRLVSVALALVFLAGSNTPLADVFNHVEQELSSLLERLDRLHNRIEL